MAVKNLYLLAFLTAQVSCGKNSLTFVIDDTYSMHDVIQQVKGAAKEIVNIVLNEKSSQIEDIVLVTFNDPDIEFRKRTSDGEELKQALDSIKVHGGGDCPEVALKGIKRALEESWPGSYLFVFTDASAKDYKDFDKIKKLTQDKQSQIVIVVTNPGLCEKVPTEADHVYHRIAAESNGQVFRVNEDEVGQVLEYVKETIKGDRTVIASTVVPAHKWSNIEFKIDDQTEYAIVSASGDKVILQIIDQNRKLMTKIAHITWTNNVKVVKLQYLTPGTYSARVHGNTEVNIMVFGRTDFTFEHGFSTKVETSLRTTQTQPTTDVKTHLMVSVKDPEHSANVHSIELLDMSDRKIRTLRLTHVQGDVYATEKFLSPGQTFKIAVIATSRRTGKTVRRVAKTPVTPIKPVYVAPVLSKTDKYIKVKEGDLAKVYCRVNTGNPNPDIKWFLKREHESNFKEISGEMDKELKVTNAQTNDYYKCVATNFKGYDDHTVQLDVQARPAFENTPYVITKNEDELVTIECKLRKGNPRPNAIEWHFKRENLNYEIKLKNTRDTLYILGAQLDHSGTYRCIAKNTEGTAEKITELVVQVAPELSKTEKYIKVKEGASVTVHCRVRKGKPNPEIKWFLKREHENDFKEISGEMDKELEATNAQTNDYYKCVATNTEGHDEHTVQLDVQARPAFENTPHVVTKNEGELVTIECKLRKGNPKPNAIEWHFKRENLNYEIKLRNTGDKLSYPMAQLEHTGTYRCIAKNTEGTAEKITELVVQVKPVLGNPEPYKSAMETTTVILRCPVTRGFPQPTINWFYKNPSSSEYISISKNEESLKLENIQLTTAGMYKCVAKNIVGDANIVVQLTVNAPPRIVLQGLPQNTPDYFGVEGDVAMRLPCTAVGHPTPKITWKVNEKIVGSDKSKEMYVEGNNLVLKNPKESNSTNNTRSYDCRASNEFGEVNQTYNVAISEYSDFNKPNESTCHIHKQPFVLNCPLPYSDPNSVRWFKNTIYHNVTGPTLRFDNPTQSESNNYTCRVSDINHVASYTFEAIIGFPPTRDLTSLTIEWEGEEKMIDCRCIQYPEGKYEWFYNGEKIKDIQSESLTLNGWGQYSCHVTNLLGSLVVNFKISTVDQNCVIPKSVFETKHMPLVLDSSSSWPAIKTVGQYFVVPHSEKLNLICQDDTPVTETNRNKFKNVSNMESIYATCDNEESFLVDGVTKKISELDCKENVTPRVKPTGQRCLGENTQMMEIGFFVNGFTEVYQSCVDMVKNVPLYTKMNTIPLEWETYASGVPVAKEFCMDECCYETIQLVNAVDVGLGPAKKATYKDNLNSVNYCKPSMSNLTNWHDIEQIMTRRKIQYTVWSGAVNYSKVGTIWTPKYLWKVLKEEETSEMIAIVHENMQKPGPKLCEGECGETTIWFEPEGDRTYCCSLDNFKKALGITIDFEES